MTLDNDTRGWIMTALSGVACVFGATFICVDVFVRLFPGKKNFRIQDSDAFLGCSLSLSAGVMLFSALYSMLPSAKQSLVDGGFTTKAASWILIACFLGGVFGIQIFSRVVHRFIPSHAVDCDHTHQDQNATEQRAAPLSNPHKHHRHNRIGKEAADKVTESSPLLSTQASSDRTSMQEMIEREDSADAGTDDSRNPPPLRTRVTASMASLISKSKSACAVDGSCFGFTDPCGKDCFKNVHSRGGAKLYPGISRSTSLPQSSAFENMANETQLLAAGPHGASASCSAGPRASCEAQHGEPHDHEPHLHAVSDADEEDLESAEPADKHHHHIPTNAFLSISLQTSIAIALHKLPEGFITYATNHANPQLGTAVFVAIAIHNITEGFALALPIFLASGSRLKAIVLSIFLGGLSQPLGAGIAAAWLHLAETDRGSDASKGISDGAYGAMFAVTAGIMASVALSLIQESFELSHSRGMCMAFTFVGMGILGISSALTA